MMFTRISMSRKLPTHVSEICWCNPSPEMGYRIETAKIKLPSQPVPRATAWLDELLDGGFEIPVVKGGERQALGILLTGPPGSGKSTFALELAYRWSCVEGRDLPPHIQEFTGKKPLQVLYATFEATAEEMIHNASSFEWKSFTEKAKPIRSLTEIQEGRVNVISMTNIEMWQVGGAPVPQKAEAGTNWLERIGRTIITWSLDYSGHLPPFSDKTPPRPPDVLIIDGLNSAPNEQNREQFYREYAQLLGAHPLVIIFILDISPTNERAEFWEYASDVVIKLDRHSQHPGDLYYVIRHLEIVKARFQYHAWGRHQMKIFKGLNEGTSSVEPNTSKVGRASERLRSHGYRTEGGIFIFPSIHFLLSGYEHMPPEVEDQTVPPQYYRPRVPNLNKILGNGFPVGRCTALVGQRGGHKSHLAFEELLYRVVYPNECRATPGPTDQNGNEHGSETSFTKRLLSRPAEPGGTSLAGGLSPRAPLLASTTPKTSFLHRSPLSVAPNNDPLPEPPPVPSLPGTVATDPEVVPLISRLVDKHGCEKALIVSLRDDEGTTRRTMTKILNRWREFDSTVPTLDALEASGLIEIMYFPPGYITPEEFYHRILLSINRLKHGDRSTPGVSVLINGLDELATRFPMCAKEPIFIPGIIQLLAGEKVSSFFVAAYEEGHSDYYGLGSMAGVILEFEHRDFPRDDVRLHLNAVLPGNQAIYNSESSKRKNQSLRRAVVVTVSRFSGGQSAGAEGILELLDDDAARRDLELGQAYASDYLIFIPRNHMQKGEFGFDTRAAVRGGILLNQ
jgi:KaiC/GvpD/RAD55 family RecA-like ATPase